MNETLAIQSELTMTAVAGLGVMVAIGLVMWGIGSRIIRVVFMSLGLFAGGFLGWAIGEMVPESVGLPVWMIPVLGAMVLAIVAVVTCRLAIAVTLAVSLGLAVPVGARALADVRPDWFGLPPRPAHVGQTPELVTEVEPTAERPAEPRDELDDWLDKIAGRSATESPITDPAAAVAADAARSEVEDGLQTLRDELGLDPETTRAALDRGRAYLEPMIDAGIEWWKQTPVGLQPILIAAAAAAALAGALVGSLAPNPSAGIVTALGGSMLWMTSGTALLWHAGVPAASWWPQTPTAWVVCWIAVSIIGLAIQWTLRARRADKAA